MSEHVCGCEHNDLDTTVYSEMQTCFHSVYEQSQPALEAEYRRDNMADVGVLDARNYGGAL